MTGNASPWFVDTGYILALTSARDQWFDVAASWEERIAASRQHLITTEFVLMELGNALAKVRYRSLAINTIAALRSDPTIEIVSAAPTLFAQALDLFQLRLDKSWGLTDCTSFAVMQERAIHIALTTDDHFRQAGFRALLLES